MQIGTQRSRELFLALGISTAFLLSACHTASMPPKLDREQVRQFEARGYPAARELEVVASEELRTASEVAMRWVWLRPNDGERHPLLIYLPGAGQDANANEPWRRAIARAGYAVLSWQALPDDEQRPALGRPAAGAGSQVGVDLHDWAATRFDGPHLQQRSHLLAGLMDELRRAAAANEPALRSVDLDHVALAGYELGAQTLMLQAGEQVRGVEAPGGPSPFKAYLAISPQASFDQGSFERRFREVHGPVLTLTSDADQDPYGLGSAAYLRKAPYVSMPAGGKYLAIWRGLSHADLGGPAGHSEPRHGPADGAGTTGMPKPDETSNGPSTGDNSGARGDDGSGTSGGGHRGGRRGRGGFGGSDANARPGGAQSAGAGNAARGGASPTLRAMQASAMATVSIAFLDAELRDDKLARDWLDRDCERWLKPVAAEWSHK